MLSDVILWRVKQVIALLNPFLEFYFAEMVRKDGKLYEPTSVCAMIQTGIMLHSDAYIDIIFLIFQGRLEKGEHRIGRIL